PGGGRVWPTKWLDLPPEWRKVLLPYWPDPRGQRAGSAKDQGQEPKHRRELRKTLVSAAKTGKWPDFAIAATTIVRTKKLKVDSQLGPNKLEHFALPAQLLVKSDLFPKLSGTEKRDLAAEEGKWPEYPQKLFELAKRHDFVVPGTDRPCPMEFWNAMSKLLPD